MALKNLFKSIAIGKTSHIEKVKQENATVRDQVQQLLGWSELKYAQYVEAMGYKYLENEFGYGNPVLNELPYHKEYWAWWVNHWIKRDIAFLREAPLMKADVRETVYTLRNNPTSLIFKGQELYLRQSYGVMIGKLIKRAVNG